MKVVVIGGGFVGSRTAARCREVGWDVTVLDKDPTRGDTTNPGRMADCDVVFVCVNTDVTSDGKLDLRAFLAAALRIPIEAGLHIDVVCIESTLPVGFTRGLFSTDSTKGSFVIYAPHRIWGDGEKVWPLQKIPRIVSGLTREAALKGAEIYSVLCDAVVLAPSVEAAEMVKLWENAYRAVNILLANEMAEVAKRHGLNPKSIAGLASTKPFGFERFDAGFPGGSCLPIAIPYILQGMTDGLTPLLKLAQETIERGNDEKNHDLRFSTRVIRNSDQPVPSFLSDLPDPDSWTVTST